jgi:hypothetical protein
MPACFAHENLADDAAVTASSQELLLPATNVQNPHVARKWRSLFTADSLIMNFGALVSIDTVALMGLTADTYRVRLSSVDSSGVAGDLYDSGTLSVNQTYLQAIALVTAPVSAQYLRIDLATSSTDYIEMGRVFAGVRTELEINFGYDWASTTTDRAIRAKTRGGQTQVFPDNCYRTLDVTFKFLTETERNGVVETIERSNGQHTDLLFVIDPDSTNLARDSVWGLISTTTPIVQPIFDRFSKQYQIEERL